MVNFVGFLQKVYTRQTRKPSNKFNLLSKNGLFVYIFHIVHIVMRQE